MSIISPIHQGVTHGIERRRKLDETLAAFGEDWEWGWNLRDTAEEIFRHMPEERPNSGPEPVAPWELRIGLSKFYVPPININVSQTYKAGALTGGALRQESAPKFNTGHKETVISMTLYFPNYESIWGVEDQLLRLRFESVSALEGPSDSWDYRRNPREASADAEIDRFMSTLRGLIAQFKYAPFLPIRNAYLNKVFGITGVTMKDMSISTVPNFPNCIAVQLIMYKFNHKTYLPMIDHFDQGIHWGRFRSYAGRAVGRLAQSSRPIRAWDEHNQIMNSTIDVGAIEPSLIRASDYIAKNQGTPIGSEQTFRRLSFAEVDDFELYFPLHTPQRIDIPSTAFVEDEFNDETSSFLPEPWWRRTLSRLGLNVADNPEASYEEARRVAEDMGSTYLSPGNTGFKALKNWLDSYGYTIENMSSAAMNQFISIYLNDRGIYPNHPAYADEVAEVRQMWVFYLYRGMMEDPYLANTLAMDDRRARQLTINEWELPMFPLDLDKGSYKVVGISASTSNNIARHQLQMEDEPTHQHIGGGDDRLDISMIFTGPNAERELTRLRMMMDQIGGLARLEQGHGVLGFLGLRSVLASLVGMRYVIPVGFEVETIPNQPGSYSVNLSFIDFDIFQQKREQLDPSQQAYLAEQFGKQNPFLRIKQMWGAFNGHPDLPLGVHDSNGRLVGHLDPDYYFKSFQVIDDDIVEPGPSRSQMPESAWRGTPFVDTLKAFPPQGPEEETAPSIIGAAIPIRVNLPQIDPGDGNVIAPGMEIYPNESNEVHLMENGHFLDDPEAGGLTFSDGGTAAALGAPAMIKGMTPASEHSNPLFFGDNPASQFHTMSKDMQYRDNSGRMVRAFPTYMLWLIDEAGFGYGMRFFDNFYGLQSVIDFSVVQSDEPLNDTLVLRLSNLYSKLSTKFHDYLSEDNEEDVTARIINSFTEKYHRMLTGQADYIAQLDTVQLKPGIRVHLRAGYSANPNRLETIFNGTITEVEEGEVLTVVAQSDAMELSALVDTEDEDSHSGKIDGSLSGLYLSEPRDLMVTLLSEGASRVKEFIAWATRGDVFSENRYGIKHFGNILYTYMDGEERRVDGVKKDTIASIFTQYEEEREEAVAESDQSLDQYEGSISGATYGPGHVLWELLKTGWVNRNSTRDMEIFKRNIYPGNGIGIGQYLGGDLGDIGLSQVLNAANMTEEEQTTNDEVYGQISAATGSQGREIDPYEGSGSPASERPIEYDRRSAVTGSSRANGSASLTERGLRHAPTGSTTYRPFEGGTGYPGLRNLLEILGITNPQDEDGPFDEVAFRASTYMQTVWDMFQVSAALLPNYIVAVRPFEERSTVFYGKPHWLYTSGVIPLTQGAYAGEGVAFMEPDEETAQLRDDIVSIMMNRDEVNDLENFANEISYWDADGLENPSTNTTIARTWDPTTGTWTRGSSVSDAEGADLATEAAWQAGFRGDDLVIMVAIAGEESGWDPGIHNDDPSSGDDSYGLWQINLFEDLGPSRRERFNLRQDDELLDPFLNAEVAKALSDSRDSWEGRPDSRFRDWSVYNTGIYRDGHGTQPNSMSIARDAVSRFMANYDNMPANSPVQEETEEERIERNRQEALHDNAYDRIRTEDGAVPSGNNVYIPETPIEDEMQGEGFSNDFTEIFLRVIGETKGDHQIPEIREEFPNTFLEDDLFIPAFKASRLVAPLDEEEKQQVADEVAESVGQMFLDWVISNPYAFGWVVRTANARGNALTGSTLIPWGNQKWDFSETYQAFVAFCGYGTKAAEEYMADNLDAGRRTSAIGSSLWNVLTNSEYREEAGIAGQVVGLPGELISGVTNMVRLSLFNMTQGMSMSTDMQKRANVLNRTLNDSIYFNAGRDSDGNVEYELLNAADNPFTREYGEPVAEIREPFSRMHTLGSFQHIIHNGIIQSLDDVSTVVTATSNDGEVVTVHFDKGLPSDRQVETTIDTGIYWDEPTGWFGLNKLANPIQSMRALHRRMGWGRANEMVSSEISAKRIALYHLKRSLETLYRGELTIVGDPSIRPHDLAYMMDTYSRMYGFINVKQVVHHMTPEMGFITQVTPALPVHINDPARWSIMARWKGSLAAHSVRETARRVLVDNDQMASQLMDQYGQDNNMAARDMTIDDLIDVFDTQIQGSLQYTEGIGSLIGDQLSAAASGSALNRWAMGDFLRAPMTGDLVRLAERWGPFKWFRDNMLDQHGCYVDFLTKNGQAMDGNLSYSQGTAVGHPRERSLIIGGLKLFDIPVTSPNGSRIIPTEQVIPHIKWQETDGLTNHAKQISLFHDVTISRVRDLAFSGEFLSNFASDVYWARITNIVDADTFDVEILGHAPNGVYQDNTSLTIGNADQENRLRLFGADAAEDDFKHDSVASRNLALEQGDLGVRATEWVKQKLASPEVNSLVAIRVVQPNSADQFNRGLGHVFINAPGGYWDEEDPANQQRRREYLLNAAGRIPVKAWDSYTEDGKPHTLDWELVTKGFAHVFSNDLRAVQPGRGARGG